MKFNRVILPFILLGVVELSASQYNDSGSIHQRMKSDLKHSLKQKKVLPAKVIEEKEVMKFDTSHKIYVRGFHIEGNEHLTEAQLHEAMAPFVHRELSATQLQFAAKSLMSYYREKSFFAAKVYLPPHSVHNGIITLHVYEGHLEDAGIELRNSGERVKSEKIMKLLEHTLQPGIMIKEEFERAILLTDDFPGINSKATIYPGKEVGTARLMMETTDEDVFSGNIDIDNFGDYYTGENRLGTTLYFNSPTKNGEEIVVRLVTTGKYSNFGYLDLAVPVFNYDTRVGVSLDYLAYELDHQVIDTGAKGNAWDIRAYIKHPFIRTRHLNVIGEASYIHTEMTDENRTTELLDRSLDKVVLKISGDHDDDFWANGKTYFSASLKLGNLNLDNTPEYKAYDALTADTEGDFAKINIEISRLQHLVGDFSMFASLEGQLASKNLDSSEELYIGGPYSVSGYPVGELSADEGAIFHIDLRYDMYDMPWKGNLQLSTFYTGGWAKRHKDTWDGWNDNTIIQDNEVIAHSVGIGLSQSWEDTAVVRAMLGKQVGNDESAHPITEEHHDQSDSDYRFWLNVIYYF